MNTKKLKKNNMVAKQLNNASTIELNNDNLCYLFIYFIHLETDHIDRNEEWTVVDDSLSISSHNTSTLSEALESPSPDSIVYSKSSAKCICCLHDEKEIIFHLLI